MEVIFFITLFLYIFIFGSLTSFVDYDFFARLIVGKAFFQTGDIFKYDFLSYSKTHPWYDHEWGASVIFYFIHDNFGDIGLHIFKALCVFITFFFLVSIIKLRRRILTPDKKYPIFNFLFFFLMIQPLSTLVFSLRCHHFTFVFFAIWLYVLEKNYRILWVLPLLMVVWSNIHGGCFMGLFITGLYILGEFLNKKPIVPYILTFIFSFLLMFINPYGIDYVKFLIEATTMKRPNITEWQPLFGKYFLFKFIKFKLILGGFLALTIYKLKKSFLCLEGNTFFDKLKMLYINFDKTKFILLFTMFLLPFKSARFITYFIFIVTPFCYDDFYSIFNKTMGDKKNKIKELTIFTVILIAFILNVITRDMKYESFHRIYPLSEIEYLLENNVKGNLFVPFESGSYTAYKLYPNMFILQDGRYEEVYPPNLNDEYVKIITTGAIGWEEKFNSIHHDAVITYKNYNLYENLKKNPDYYHIIESKSYALFIRKDVYERIKKPVKIPTSDPEFYKKTIWNTSIDWLKK